MDALGIIQPAVAQTLPKPVAQTPLLPQTDESAPSVVGANDQVVDTQVQAAEQKRFEAVQRAAQDIANIYVVSDQKFTIFKDATGQYITRFTNLRDGKVTYLPEPQLLKASGSGASQVLNIKA